MLLSDRDVVKLVKLFVNCFFYFDKIDHQTKWRENWNDASSKGKEVSGFLPFIVMSYILADYLNTWKPHNIIKQIIHKWAWLSCIKHDFSKQIDLFAYLFLCMRYDFSELINEFEKSENLSSFRKTFLNSFHNDDFRCSGITLFKFEVSWWFLTSHIKASSILQCGTEFISSFAVTQQRN